MADMVRSCAPGTVFKRLLSLPNKGDYSSILSSPLVLACVHFFSHA